MNIEAIARKLAPIMPDKVEHWMRVRESADPELRSLIERQIVETAYKHLGDFQHKPLLSLPPKELCAGRFHLGTVLYESKKWDFCISPQDLIQNTVICGRSGSGKTNVTLHLLQQFADARVPFLFLDWKRTVRHIVPRLKTKLAFYTPGRKVSPFQFNPFISPPGLEWNVYLNQVIDALADAYTLGDGAKRILQKSIGACYQRGNTAPTLQEIISEIEQFSALERSKGWKVSALRALESLAFSDFLTTDALTQDDLVTALLYGQTVIELDALDQSAKKFLIPILCLWIYYAKLNTQSRESLDFVVFIEEAHNVLHKTDRHTLMDMLIRQCRELGIGLIIVDQHPHLLSSSALGNSYLSIFLNQKDVIDRNRAAGICMLNEYERDWLSKLTVGQGIVKLQDRWSRPFVVQFPHVQFVKGHVTDQRLAVYAASVSAAGSAVSDAKSVRYTEFPQVPVSDTPFSDSELVFLEDILAHKDDGVKERYKRLNFSVGRGNRMKERLASAGWIEEQRIPIGNTRKVLLRPTRKTLDLWESSRDPADPGALVTRSSLAHEFWKRRYFRLLAERGFEVQIEAKRAGGRADLVARKNGKVIGIEIETGKSDVCANVLNGLRSKFDQIVVVATDPDALAKLERQLGRTGLLIEGRVDLVLQDEFNQ